MTTKFELRADTGKRKRKDGLSKVRIKVCEGKTNIKYIPLPIYGDPAYWDNDMQIFSVEKNVKKTEAKERNKRHEENNAVLAKAKDRCKDIRTDFERAKQIPTVTQFVDKFVEKRHTEKVGSYFKNHVKNLRDTNHFGNAISYENTYNLLKLFYSNFDNLSFTDINLRFVEDFDRWLQKRKNNGNTRRNHHKTLQALIRKAIKNKVAPLQAFPYGENGFNVGSLGEKTPKRYLPLQVIKTIRTTEIENYTLEMTRRIWVAQFLCYGISFVDAGALKKSNIVVLDSGRYIRYKRQKTENTKNATPINIKISDELQSHFDWFEKNCILIDDYLFPIVSKQGYKGEQLYNHIRSRLGENNKNLKKVAKHLKIENNIPLTSYVARHSMAMALRKNPDISIDQISQAMGHADLKTTKIYLDDLAVEEMAGIADALTNF